MNFDNLRRPRQRLLEHRRHPPPTRLKPFWTDAEKAIMAWLEENGCPAAGDGNQATLELYAQKWIEHRGYEAGVSTVRRHVCVCIERRRKQLATLEEDHLGQ